MNDYAVLGDPAMVALLRKALSKHNATCLDPGELELQDEFDCRRWFSRNTPKGTFMCLGLSAQLTVANFLFTVAGTLNVIRAALGNSERLILVAYFPSNEFFLFGQLVHMLQFEKKVEFYTLSGLQKETQEAFAERCVLSMTDVSAKEAHKGSTKSPQQRREVSGQVLSEPQGGEQHRSAAQPLLEVPVASAQGAAPGDVCAERAPAEGQEAPNPVLNNPGSVQGVV